MWAWLWASSRNKDLTHSLDISPACPPSNHALYQRILIQPHHHFHLRSYSPFKRCYVKKVMDEEVQGLFVRSTRFFSLCTCQTSQQICRWLQLWGEPVEDRGLSTESCGSNHFISNFNKTKGANLLILGRLKPRLHEAGSFLSGLAFHLHENTQEYAKHHLQSGRRSRGQQVPTGLSG